MIAHARVTNRSSASAMVRAVCRYAENTIRNQACHLGAEGIVGARFDTREWLAERTHLTFKMTLTITGTAISQNHLSRNAPDNLPHPSPLRQAGRADLIITIITHNTTDATSGPPTFRSTRISGLET